MSPDGASISVTDPSVEVSFTNPVSIVAESTDAVTDPSPVVCHTQIAGPPTAAGSGSGDATTSSDEALADNCTGGTLIPPSNPNCSLSYCPADPCLCSPTVCPGLPSTQDIDAAFWFNPDPSAGLKPTLLVGHTYYMFNSVADLAGGAPVQQGNPSALFPDIPADAWPLDDVGMASCDRPYYGVYYEMFFYSGPVFYAYAFKVSTLTWSKGPDTTRGGSSSPSFEIAFNDYYGTVVEPMDAYDHEVDRVSIFNIERLVIGLKGCDVYDSYYTCQPTYLPCNDEWAGVPTGATAILRTVHQAGDEYLVFTGNVFYRYSKTTKSFVCEGRVATL